MVKVYLFTYLFLFSQSHIMHNTEETLKRCRKKDSIFLSNAMILKVPTI